MTDETTANPVVMAGDLITGPGLYEARCGEIVPITGWEDGWWVSYCDGVLDWFSSDGLQRCRANTDVGQWDLVRCVGPLAASEPQPETTSEQLVEIDRDMADIERQVAELVEEAQQADYPQPQPDSQPEPVPEPDAELRIRLLKQANDSQAETIGRLLSEARDLNMEIGGLERQLLQRDARIRDVETMHAAAAQAVVDAGKGNDKLRAQAEELRSEVSYVQNLLGTERRRVAELEELASSLRTINETQEKAFTAAGKENSALRNQLLAVKAELASVAADRQRLRVELDAAQQVPADSPELRQLRADLADVTLDRDQYKHAHELLLNDANTVHERTKAMTVEAIAEWLQAFRGCNSPSLALLLLEALPSIMRHLTGLEDEEIE